MSTEMGFVALLIGAVACVVGLVMLLIGRFKNSIMRPGQWVTLAGIVLVVAGVYVVSDAPDANAREQGFLSSEDMEAARDAGVHDAQEWAHMKAEAVAAEEREERRKGFHCLSSWDGSHREFRNAVKDAMRDPDSFEHVETRVTPVDEDGWHILAMSYRARNGFGGMNVGTAIGRYANDDCRFAVTKIE